MCCLLILWVRINCRRNCRKKCWIKTQFTKRQSFSSSPFIRLLILFHFALSDPVAISCEVFFAFCLFAFQMPTKSDLWRQLFLTFYIIFIYFADVVETFTKEAKIICRARRLRWFHHSVSVFTLFLRFFVHLLLTDFSFVIIFSFLFFYVEHFPCYFIHFFHLSVFIIWRRCDNVLLQNAFRILFFTSSFCIQPQNPGPLWNETNRNSCANNSFFVQHWTCMQIVWMLHAAKQQEAKKTNCKLKKGQETQAKKKLSVQKMCAFLTDFSFFRRKSKTVIRSFLVCMPDNSDVLRLVNVRSFFFCLFLVGYFSFHIW